jgi:hypothetical protein
VQHGSHGGAPAGWKYPPRYFFQFFCEQYEPNPSESQLVRSSCNVLDTTARYTLESMRNATKCNTRLQRVNHVRRGRKYTLIAAAAQTWKTGCVPQSGSHTVDEGPQEREGQDATTKSYVWTYDRPIEVPYNSKMHRTAEHLRELITIWRVLPLLD